MEAVLNPTVHIHCQKNRRRLLFLFFIIDILSKHPYAFHECSFAHPPEDQLQYRRLPVHGPIRQVKITEGCRFFRHPRFPLAFIPSAFECADSVCAWAHPLGLQHSLPLCGDWRICVEFHLRLAIRKPDFKPLGRVREGLRRHRPQRAFQRPPFAARLSAGDGMARRETGAVFIVHPGATASDGISAETSSASSARRSQTENSQAIPPSSSAAGSMRTSR